MRRAQWNATDQSHDPRTNLTWRSEVLSDLEESRHLCEVIVSTVTFIPSHVMPCHVMSRHIMLFDFMLHHATPCHVTQRHSLPSNPISSCSITYHVIPCKQVCHNLHFTPVTLSYSDVQHFHKMRNCRYTFLRVSELNQYLHQAACNLSELTVPRS